MNVVIKRMVAAHNVDALNRSVKCASADLENGSIFELKTRSTDEGEGEVWIATAPTAATATGLWMAKASEVVVTSTTVGTEQLDFKGIVVDPRAFVNVKGKVFDAFQPKKGDIIEMTTGADDKAYAVVDANKFAVKLNDAAGDGFAMKKIGTGILHIGSASLVKTPVKTYIYEVEKN